MLAAFPQPFVLSSPTVQNHGRWILVSTFIWQSPSGPIVVPAGFLTDGTSIPRLLWSWIPPIDGKSTYGSLIHDYLYDCLIAGTPHPFASDRATADQLLYRALRDAGVSKSSAWLVWLGVRWFGRSHARKITPTAAALKKKER